jgi:hypothetical protein
MTKPKSLNSRINKENIKTPEPSQAEHGNRIDEISAVEAN